MNLQPNRCTTEGSARPVGGGGTGAARVAGAPGEAVRAAVPDLIRDLRLAPERPRLAGRGGWVL